MAKNYRSFLKFKMRRSLSLIELLAAMIVLVILSTVAWQEFKKTRERAYDQEAVNNLISIWEAEEMYRQQNGSYFFPVGQTGDEIDEINKNLRLDISDKVWKYIVIMEVNRGYNAFTERRYSPSYTDPPPGYDRRFYIANSTRWIFCTGTGCPWTFKNF